MKKVAPKSRGKVPRVKMESDTDTLGIGASYMRQCVLQRETAVPTSTLVFAESAEQHPRNDTHCPARHGSPVPSASTPERTPPIHAQMKRRDFAVWRCVQGKVDAVRVGMRCEWRAGVCM